MSDHGAEAEEADRIYNEALTALDAAIVPLYEDDKPILEWPNAVLAPPGGVLKPWLGVIHRWLAPVFARQRTFDMHVVESVERIAGRDHARAFAKFQTALIVFLQKITAFVESKDRHVAAIAASRLDRHEHLLNQLPDLQAQVAALQRAANPSNPSNLSNLSNLSNPLNRELVFAGAKDVLTAESNALAHLESLSDGSIGGLICAAQVVERLEPDRLMRLLTTAHHKLRPGSPIVVETINPACRDEFTQPIHPEALLYLLRSNGFDNVTLQYTAPVPEHMKMQPVDVAALAASGGPQANALVEMARALNASAAILNNLLFTYLDCAAIGYRR